MAKNKWKRNYAGHACAWGETLVRCIRCGRARSRMRRMFEALRLAYFNCRDRKVLAHLRRGSEWEASRDKTMCKRFDCNEPAEELGGYCTTWCAADDRGIQAPDY